MNIKIIHNPKEAIGIAIIIDVFRAFTVEPVIINNGVKKLIVIGDKQIAYDLKKENNEYILIGERGCGTQGIVNSINAEEIITGSLVNISAIVKYINNSNYNDISIVSMARPGEEPSQEDQLCAEYIKAKLENKPIDEFNDRILNLKNTSGTKFFDNTLQKIFPKEDFYLCTDIDKYNFILKAEKDTDGYLNMRKIIIQ